MSTLPALSRRRFLAAASLSAGAVLAVDLGLAPRAAEASGYLRWSDPNTWGGRVPAAGATVVVDRAVLLDVDVVVGSLHVRAGAALAFDSATSRTLTSRGNVHVEGLLQMRPAGPQVQHRLQFDGVDEAAFVGGGMQVLKTDVGLWVTGLGVLDVAGAEKTAWVRAAEGITVGAKSIRLAAAPAGWRVGDEIVIVPTASTLTRNHFDAYDTRTIAAISGDTVSFTWGTSHAHPLVPVGPGVQLGAEILNVTRNVAVQGTPTGRAHIMIMSQRAQSLSYFATRWLAPRKGPVGGSSGVLGRYALHFHMAGEGSRGSSVTGAVVRDAGGHAFVAHGSNGIRFTSCISHDTFDEAYWWDGMVDTRTASAASNDISYRGCVASRVKSDPAFRGYRLNGFTMGLGDGCTAHDCVAVGVQGNKSASGFAWPEGPKVGVWGFARNIGHNNKIAGIFTWHNNSNTHDITDFVMYHNGEAGIQHGAYVNSYHYRNGYLYGNGIAGIDLHSNSSDGRGQRFTNLVIDGAGRAQHGIRLHKHTLGGSMATVVEGCRFRGHAGAAIAHVYDGSNGPSTPEWLDVVGCTSDTPMLRLRDSTLRGTGIRVQDAGAAVLAMEPTASAGTLRQDWYAKVVPVAPFATTPAPTNLPPLIAAAPVLTSAGTPGLANASGTGGSSSLRHGAASPLAVDATMRRSGAGVIWQVRNNTSTTCSAVVRQSGKVLLRVQLKPGASTLRVPRVQRGALLEVDCHGRLLQWHVQ